MTTATSGRKATVTKKSDRELNIERVFDAPRDRVWRAMTDPKLLAQWWGRGNKLVVEKYEFERGGHWRFVEHTDHGAFGFEGRYREINAPNSMEMTFEWDGMPGHVIIQKLELVDLGDGRTKMVASSQFFTPEELDGMLKSGMEGGMNASYAALDRVLAEMD